MFPRLSCGTSATTRGYCAQLLSVDQWGDIVWSSFANAFDGAKNLTINATDTPNLVNVKSFNAMFAGATSLTAFNISGWDVSNIDDFRSMFAGATSYDQDLSMWTPTGVTKPANYGNMFNVTAMSVYNYNELLDKRSQLPLVASATAVAFGADTKYGGCETNAQAGIDGHLRFLAPVADGGKNWKISDGGLAICEQVVNYPNCNRADITYSGFTLAACNVGASKAGTGYSLDISGKKFQRGNNYGWMDNEEVKTSSTQVINPQRPYSSGTFITVSVRTGDWATPNSDTLL
jgi:surface protein